MARGPRHIQSTKRINSISLYSILSVVTRGNYQLYIINYPLMKAFSVVMRYKILGLREHRIWEQGTEKNKNNCTS